MNTIGYDTFAFRMQNYGGISKLFEELINGINREQHISDIEAVAIENIPSNWSERLTARSIAIDNTRSKLINAGLRRIPRMQHARIDFWHMTYYRKPRYVLPRTPFGITVHDFTPELFPSLMENELTHLNKMQLIGKADLIFCVSQTTKQHLIDFFPKIQEERIRVAHVGPSIPKSDAQIKRTRPYFLIVGRNDRHKNMDLILESISYFKDFDFIFFGLFKKDIPSKYFELNPGRIHSVTGDSQLLSMYYNGAYAYINSSFSEGFCIPVLDALISNCPAIVSDLQVFRELYGNSVHYFDPHNLDSLIDKMRSFTSHDLVSFDKDKFSWDKTIQIHAESYREFLN
jgi:mannosyltransferase